MVDDLRVTQVSTSTLNETIFGTLYHFGSDALFTIGVESLRIVSANHGLSELVGHSNETLVGLPAYDLFIADERVDDWVATIAERAGLYEEVALRRIDDYPVYVALTVAHVESSPEPVIACIARDTTDRRKLERQLISKHAALYSAHAELATAFNTLRATQERLEERNRELSIMGARLANAAHRAAIGEFSAGVAHSINNPLGAAMSALRQLDKLADRCEDDQLGPRLSHFLSRAHNALGRMESIVDTTRRAHRCGNIGTTAKHLVIADEIAVTMALFEGSTANIDVIYDITAGLTGWIPPDALHHVFANLVDNSVSLMRDGGKLAIELRDDGEFAVLTVEDTAGGVPDDIRDTMFEPFVTRREGGTGLGLSMAQRLARNWGGDVVYEPTELGTRLSVLIPKEAPDGATQDSHR